MGCDSPTATPGFHLIAFHGNRWEEIMSKQAAEHHHKAAEHHEQAARHHKEAAKHHESGKHEITAHHAHLARAHHEHAAHHGVERPKRISKITARPAQPTLSLLGRGAPSALFLSRLRGIQPRSATVRSVTTIILEFVEGARQGASADLAKMSSAFADPAILMRQ